MQDIKEVVEKYGGIFGGRYVLAEDRATLLLDLLYSRNYKTLEQAADLLGNNISIIGGTKEFDVPTFLRKERIQHPAYETVSSFKVWKWHLKFQRRLRKSPYVMSEGEKEERLQHPENFSTYEIVISPQSIIKREMWNDKRTFYESSTIVDGSAEIEPIIFYPLK